MTEPPESEPKPAPPAPPAPKMHGVRVPPPDARTQAGGDPAGVTPDRAPVAEEPARPPAPRTTRSDDVPTEAPAGEARVSSQAPEVPAQPPAAKAPPPAATTPPAGGASPPKPVAKPAARPAAAEAGKAPGYAAKLAKGGDAEQEPLVGSADFGWKVFNAFMTVGLIALSAIVLVSCARMVKVWLSVL